MDWAEPENEIDEEVMSRVKVLFVRNLMNITNEDQIRSVFESLIEGCDGGAVERVKKSKDYAFVHFRDELLELTFFAFPRNIKQIKHSPTFISFTPQTARCCQTHPP